MKGLSKLMMNYFMAAVMMMTDDELFYGCRYDDDSGVSKRRYCSYYP